MLNIFGYFVCLQMTAEQLNVYLKDLQQHAV